jgi:glycosyltransferase involved in cell wall biosynthesis
LPEILSLKEREKKGIRILWHSVAAHVGSGYGNTTRNITSRLVRLGYDIIVSAYYGLEPGGTVLIHGVPHIPSKMGKFGKDSCILHVRRYKPDIAFLNTDWWAFPWFPKLPCITVCHSPMDHENYAEELIKLTKSYDYVCSYSRWQQKRLKENGIESYYTPHGVDTKIFRPMPKEEARRITRFPQDKFFILRVAANCFDPETEILTREGWKKYNELTYDTEILTLNKSGYMEYQKPTRIIVQKDYSGMMYRLKTKYLDIMVTPNHKLLVKRKITLRKDRPKEKELRNMLGKSYFFTEYYPEYAVDNYGKPRWFKKNGKWKGIEVKSEDYNILDYIELLGYYISEGNIQDNLIIINQRKEESRKKIIECIERLGFEYRLYKDKIAIKNNELLEECKKLGHASEKYIPEWILELDKEYLERLWNALITGDGWKTSNSETYSTTSKKLAGQVQELLLKMGYAGDIYTKKSKNSNWKDCYIIHRNSTVLEVQKRDTSKKKKKLFLEEWIPYNGLVWCVEVPNHTIYVRRNGKVVWSCQSDKEDRKSHARCFKAIRLFLEDNPDARKDIMVYCHCNPKDPRGVPLHYFVHKQGLDDIVSFISPELHHLRLSMEEMALLYNSSDILLNPSKREGFGLPILESLSCGRPVIVTDFSSMTELGKGHGWIVRNLLDKENLITTPINADSSLPDVYDIERAIEDAFNHPEKCEKYGKAGRRFALDYDWDRIIETCWIPLLEDIPKKEEEKRRRKDEEVRKEFRKIFKKIKEGKKK